RKVRMNEVEVRTVWNTIKELQLAVVPYAIPTHVWHAVHRRRKPAYHTGNNVETTAVTELLAAGEQQLVADADAEERAASVQRAAHRIEEAQRGEAGHGVVEGAVAGEHHRLRLVDGLRVLGDDGRHAHVPDEPLDRPEIAPSVIHDRDHGRGLERALGGWQHAGDARVDPRGLGQAAADRLEHRLGDVVEVVAVVHGHVQRDLGVEGEGAEELLQHVEVEVRHARARHRDAEDQERPAREIDGGLHQRL